jgi:hypothetical protein
VSGPRYSPAMQPVTDLHVLQRVRTSATLRPVAASGLLLVAALAAGLLLEHDPRIALAVPGVALAALLASRHPAPLLIAVVALTGSYGSIAAFTSFPVGETVDVALAGLWVVAIWHVLFARRKRAFPVWPAVVGTALYLGITAFQILTAQNLELGLYAFRVGGWYMAALLLVAYGPWSNKTLGRVTRGIVVVATLVGAYAVLREITGPAAEESYFASNYGGKRTDVLGGESLLFGSLPSRHELGLWSGVALPFLVAFALGAEARWRLLAAVGAVACAVGLLGSEVRIGVLAAGFAVLLVAALYITGRAFRGPRIRTAFVLLLVGAIVGVVGFGLTVGKSEPSTSRYERIFQPSSDPAVQDRTDNWEIGMRQVRRQPLGQGLGSAGRAAAYARFTRFETLTAQVGLDNSYLQIAIQQGVIPALLFIASAWGLLFTLGRRAVAVPERWRATPAIGAAGALASFLIFLITGTYIEGLPALFAWIIVGVGLGHLLRPERPVPTPGGRPDGSAHTPSRTQIAVLARSPD